MIHTAQDKDRDPADEDGRVVEVGEHQRCGRVRQYERDGVERICKRPVWREKLAAGGEQPKVAIELQLALRDERRPQRRTVNEAGELGGDGDDGVEAERSEFATARAEGGEGGGAAVGSDGFVGVAPRGLGDVRACCRPGRACRCCNDLSVLPTEG